MISGELPPHAQVVIELAVPSPLALFLGKGPRPLELRSLFSLGRTGNSEVRRAVGRPPFGDIAEEVSAMLWYCRFAWQPG